MLSEKLAQQIATETTEAIGYNVIITDATGTIIGSGDVARVGTFHEASVEVMRMQETMWHTPDQARAMEGVRPGVTLPLVVAREAVGTVGITGTPRQVRRFGLLVRRQTEMLMEESALVRSRLLHERALEELVAQVAYHDPEVVDGELLVAGARDLGFALLRPRTALMLDAADAVVGPELLRTVRSVFRRREDIVATHGVNRCVVLADTPSNSSRSVHATAARVVSSAEQRLGVQLRIGVGPAAATLGDMRDACADAADALRLAGRVIPGQAVVQIAQLRAAQALAALAVRDRERLIDHELGALLRAGDGPMLCATVIGWCESGFNLVAAAQELHIHRNTLVYRLDKLESLLGRPWRDHRAMLTTYLACLARQTAAGPEQPTSTRT